MLKKLHRQPFQLRREGIEDCPRSRGYDRLELENLIEEMEPMGRSQKNAMSNNLKIWQIIDGKEGFLRRFPKTCAKPMPFCAAVQKLALTSFPHLPLYYPRCAQYLTLR